MNGLDIVKAFYFEYGKPMLVDQFGDVYKKIAAGLAGEGSECFGFDDEISKDHDFEPGFCLWLTREDAEIFGFKLERAYAKLPRQFMGLSRSLIPPVGGNRRGVITIDDFYKKFLGSGIAPTSLEHWLSLPPYALACATNGEVFTDELGEFTKIRQALSLGYPDDVKYKKLAAHAAFMAQSGQYNYIRCIKRGELGAAALALNEFVKHAISTVYLLNNSYEPFYKWAFKGMRKLDVLSGLESPLTAIISGTTLRDAEKTEQTVFEISAAISAQYRRLDLSTAMSNGLERHAIQIQNKIKDPNIRNMHILDGI